MSKIETNTVDNRVPNWTATFIERNKIVDETGMIQLGFSEERIFESVEVRVPEPSTAIWWPTRENPNQEYRITGAWLELGQATTTIERQTYSLLELVGDVGGLYDGLRLIAQSMLAPLVSIALK